MDAVAAIPSGELKVKRLPAISEIVPVTFLAGSRGVAGSSMTTGSELGGAGVLTEERPDPLRMIS
jgi:hypothetical protein